MKVNIQGLPADPPRSPPPPPRAAGRQAGRQAGRHKPHELFLACTCLRSARRAGIAAVRPHSLLRQAERQACNAEGVAAGTAGRGGGKGEREPTHRNLADALDGWERPPVSNLLLGPAGAGKLLSVCTAIWGKTQPIVHRHRQHAHRVDDRQRRGVQHPVGDLTHAGDRRRQPDPREHVPGAACRKQPYKHTTVNFMQCMLSRDTCVIRVHQDQQALVKIVWSNPVLSEYC